MLTLDSKSVPVPNKEKSIKNWEPSVAQSFLGAVTAFFVKDVMRVVSACVGRGGSCVALWGRSGDGNWI